MNVGTWIALAGFGFTIVLQIIGCAFLFGGLFAKVRGMERNLEGSDNCAVQLAAVNATLEGMKATILNVEHNIKNLWQALPAATRRKASPED